MYVCIHVQDSICFSTSCSFVCLCLCRADIYANIELLMHARSVSRIKQWSSVHVHALVHTSDCHAQNTKSIRKYVSIQIGVRVAHTNIV
jgi:hypothetical protein